MVLDRRRKQQYTERRPLLKALPWMNALETLTTHIHLSYLSRIPRYLSAKDDFASWEPSVSVSRSPLMHSNILQHLLRQVIIDVRTMCTEKQEQEQEHCKAIGEWLGTISWVSTCKIVNRNSLIKPLECQSRHWIYLP